MPKIKKETPAKANFTNPEKTLCRKDQSLGKAKSVRSLIKLKVDSRNLLLITKEKGKVRNLTKRESSPSFSSSLLPQIKSQPGIIITKTKKLDKLSAKMPSSKTITAKTKAD